MYSCTISIHRLRFFFFFNDTAPTEIYTLSLHAALPISLRRRARRDARELARRGAQGAGGRRAILRAHEPLARRPVGRVRGHADRKSTRLNSSHANISYAVFCLKKKKI